jgi:Na+/H+ antiporter NhaD/arsenite permease-like protein
MYGLIVVFPGKKFFSSLGAALLMVILEVVSLISGFVDNVPYIIVMLPVASAMAAKRKQTC